MKIVYAIMDGRARVAYADGLVLSVCETKPEAMREKDEYGDAIVVQCEIGDDGTFRYMRTVG
jgi:hypothetical protein